MAHVEVDRAAILAALHGTHTPLETDDDHEFNRRWTRRLVAGLAVLCVLAVGGGSVLIWGFASGTFALGDATAAGSGTATGGKGSVSPPPPPLAVAPPPPPPPP